MTDIFVFGSNLAGRHGAGAALYAKQNHGAIYGIGEGLQGNSYGIPTKDNNLNTLDLTAIASYVDQFIQFAQQNPNLKFNVTPIGCGLAGYKPKDIAPLFLKHSIPININLPKEFLEVNND